MEELGDDMPRSLKNSEKLSVRFVNCCGKTAQIFWVSYEGQLQLFTTLKPRQFVDMNTYTKHAWIFKEHDTGERLMGNNKRHFCGVDRGFNSASRSRLNKRYLVYISRPLVMKLRTICIDYVCRRLKQCSDVKFLEIPITLKREIVKKIHSLDPSSHDAET